MSPARIRVVVADDHAVVRHGLREILEATPGMDVVGEGSEGTEALRLTKEQSPGVLVLDLSMPGPGGVEISRTVRTRCPGTRVLVLTMHATRSHLKRLLDAGAAGYVLKSSAVDELLRAVRTVAGGGTWIDPVLAGKVLASSRDAGDVESALAESGSILSRREEEVLRKVARGHPNKRIGELLGISTRTVETYKARIARKLGLRGRAEMVRYALERGWLTNGEE